MVPSRSKITPSMGSGMDWGNGHYPEGTQVQVRYEYFMRLHIRVGDHGVNAGLATFER